MSLRATLLCICFVNVTGVRALTNSCSPHCRHHTTSTRSSLVDSLLPACNPTTGQCFYGCEENFEGDRCDTCVRGMTGPNCNLVCDYNCQNCTWDFGVVGCTICRSEYYYFNKRCEQCRWTCLRNSISDLPTCDPIDGTCTFGCRNGWYGEQCSNQCGALCVNGTCDSSTGCCTAGCKYSSYGGCQCQTPCNENCILGTCNQNLTCTLGCKKNFWGPDCSQPCSSKCRESSNNLTSPCGEDGQCTFGCKTNFTGPQCTARCPNNCLHGNCDQVSGACIDGCTTGKTGAFCNVTDTCTKSENGVSLQSHESENSTLLEIILNRLKPKCEIYQNCFQLENMPTLLQVTANSAKAFRITPNGH